MGQALSKHQLWASLTIKWGKVFVPQKLIDM